MSSLYRSFQVLFFSAVLFFPLQGCGMFESDLVKEMDKVYSVFEGKLTDEQKKIRKGKVDEIVQKYFPVGSSAQDAINYLGEIGFGMVEYKKDRWRKLPSGEFQEYNSVGFKEGATAHLVSESRILAEIQVHLALKYILLSPISFFLSEREFKVYINIDENGKIVSSSGKIIISSI